MLIRRLVIASLLASATAAHADTIPAAPASGVVSGWTTGNGTDVLSSGVLQGNMNLVAGVSHSAGGGASLADVLYGKVAGTIGKVDGQTTLFFQRGIEANYLLASGHGILAATVGMGKSVVGSADGVTIKDGVTKAPGQAGGGNSQVVTGGGGGTTGGGTQTTPSNTNSNSGANGNSGNSGNVSTGNGAPNTGTGNAGPIESGSNGNIVLDNGIGNSPVVVLPPPSGLPGPALVIPEGTVPEPSSIALMLLGMMGAAAAARRRTR